MIEVIDLCVCCNHLYGFSFCTFDHLLTIGRNISLHLTKKCNHIVLESKQKTFCLNCWNNFLNCLKFVCLSASELFLCHCLDGNNMVSPIKKKKTICTMYKAHPNIHGIHLQNRISGMKTLLQICLYILTHMRSWPQ